MSYAIELLQSALNAELRALHAAKSLTKGEGFFMAAETMAAFDESKRLAQERVPELQNAIAKLKGIEI